MPDQMPTAGAESEDLDLVPNTESTEEEGVAKTRDEEEKEVPDEITDQFPICDTKYLVVSDNSIIVE